METYNNAFSIFVNLNVHLYIQISTKEKIDGRLV